MTLGFTIASVKIFEQRSIQSFLKSVTQPDQENFRDDRAESSEIGTFL